MIVLLRDARSALLDDGLREFDHKGLITVFEQSVDFEPPQSSW